MDTNFRRGHQENYEHADSHEGELLAITSLDKLRTNPEVYDRFLDAAHGTDFQRANSIKNTMKKPMGLDRLDWLTSHVGRFQDMFYKDACEHMSKAKVETFFDLVRNDWSDGKKRRLNSDNMRGLFASIRDYYQECLRSQVATRVKHLVPADIDAEPNFEPDEIQGLIQCSKQVLHPFVDQYIKEADFSELVVDSDLWVHRGMHLPEPLSDKYSEKLCMVSWTTAISVAEQFASATPVATDCWINLSTRITDIWANVLIFTPFVPGMSIEQYEFLVVPQWCDVPVKNLGEHAGVHEYELVWTAR